MRTMSTIEDRLWTDLLGEAEADRALAARQPPPRRRSLRGIRLAVGSAIILGVTIALALTGGTSTTPAYGVAVNADGSVTLTLNEVIGVSGANEALERLGVRARIARIESGCIQTAEPIHGPPGEQSNQQLQQMVESQKAGEGLSGLEWVIHPHAIPPGDTVLITAQLANEGRPVATYHGKAISAVGSSLGLYRGAAPTCQPPAETYAG